MKRIQTMRDMNFNSTKMSLKDLYPKMMIGETPMNLTPSTQYIAESQNFRFTEAVIQSVQFHLKIIDPKPRVVKMLEKNEKLYPEDDYKGFGEIDDDFFGFNEVEDDLQFDLEL